MITEYSKYTKKSKDDFFNSLKKEIRYYNCDLTRNDDIWFVQYTYLYIFSIRFNDNYILLKIDRFNPTGKSFYSIECYTLEQLRNRIIYLLNNYYNLNVDDFYFQDFLNIDDDINFSFEFVKHVFHDEKIFNIDNLNKNIINIIKYFLKYNLNIIPYTSYIKKYLTKDNLDEIKVIKNANDFGLL